MSVSSSFRSDYLEEIKKIPLPAPPIPTTTTDTEANKENDPHPSGSGSSVTAHLSAPQPVTPPSLVTERNTNVPSVPLSLDHSTISSKSDKPPSSIPLSTPAVPLPPLSTTTSVPPLPLTNQQPNSLPTGVLPLTPSSDATPPVETGKQNYPSRPLFEPSKPLRVVREKTCFERKGDKSVFSSDSDSVEGGVKVHREVYPSSSSKPRKPKVVYTMENQEGPEGPKASQPAEKRVSLVDPKESKKNSLPFSDPVPENEEEAATGPLPPALANRQSVVSLLSRARNSLLVQDTTLSKTTFVELADAKQTGGILDPVRYRSLLVNIYGMSLLHADSGVVHPFLRVWTVNALTGENLMHGHLFALTQPYDLRTNESRAPFWNAQLLLTIDHQKLAKDPQNVLLLFELLDVGCETIHGFYLPREGLYPIAWAYCFLHNSAGQMHPTELSINLQFFRYPHRTPWWLYWIQTLLPSMFAADAVNAPSNRILAVSERSGPPSESAPAVYAIFDDHRNRKIPYEGGLCLSFSIPDAPDPILRPTCMTAFEEYLLNTLSTQWGSCSIPKCLVDSDGRPSELRSRSKTFMPDKDSRRVSQGVINYPALEQLYFRKPDERTLPPTSTLQTVPVIGKVSCMAFSMNGALLALGVSRNLQHVVEVRNPLAADLTLYNELHGHIGHIYSIAFQKSDELMLSCSSDHTVRVWRVSLVMEGQAHEEDDEVPSPNPCLCTLPHGYPVYTAIFHQSHIVTGGYNHCLSVWAYDKPVHVRSMSFNSLDDSSFQLTQDFNPIMQMPTTSLNEDGEAEGGRADSVVLAGQIVERVSNEENVIFTSLGSTEKGHRVWSVSSSGKVCGWRAVNDVKRRGESVWQMTVNKKQTHECTGASVVHVGDEYTVVTSFTAPLVHIFDTKSCDRLRLVRSSIPTDAPFCLFPDGKALVAGTKEGKLMGWDCFDGAPCTSVNGYSKVKTRFPITEIAWACDQQVGALKSPAPCPHALLSSTLPHVNWDASGVNGENPLHAEVTIISIVGTKRDEGSIIPISDKTSSSEEFCLRFGGELDAKKKAFLKAKREMEMREREQAKEHAGERLYPRESNTRTMTSVYPEDSFREAATTNAYMGRINGIINFWRGLVDQHRRNDQGQLRSEDSDRRQRRPRDSAEVFRDSNV